MAKGILGFLGFGKREKPNLTQNFRELPRAESAPLYGTMKDFAERRIRGEDGGFGDDFASLANPAITARQRRFREETIPTLSNQASSRGLGRSSLVTNQIQRAERDTQNDIDQMLSNFEYLNRVERNRKITEGLGVGQNLNSMYLDQNSRGAQAFNEAELGNTNRTVGQATARNQRADQMQDRTMQAIGSLASPLLGDLYKGMVPNSASAQRDSAITGFLRNRNPVQANILQANDEDMDGYDIPSLIQALKLVGKGSSAYGY